MTENTANISDEISLKDLIFKLKQWWNYIIKQWKIIALIGLIGGLAAFLYASNQKATYSAKVTFVVEEGKSSSSSLGGLASLAGQFGVDVGGSSGGGLLSGDNILLYFKSPSLAREVLLSSFDSSTNASIADVYASVYELNKEWSENEKIGNVVFPILNSNVSYSRLQDSLLQTIVNTIVTSQFTVTRTDKKAGFIDVTSTMRNELLAKIYCERIVQKVVERYINIKTQRQNATVQKLQLRVDSIANLLNKKTVSSASLQNSSSTMDINPLYRTGTSVAVESNLRDKTLLTTIFASVTQNLEMAKFTLSQETPVIQIVDSPILPLKKERMSILKTAFSGFFLFAFIAILGVVMKRVYVGLMLN
ncbi:MAG TPA: hypothetical protein PLC18_14045 [Sediminibacterium sp.]|uniref:hypothetical protein n=1 Tax=Sediminibacterium sp. TaxID=1917865 RepID=UPI002CF1A989|nr:hypothetical protein [Sediminibacterium sp.]HQS36532.1 hypothetical protein [Sediminibacterium sp.]